MDFQIIQIHAVETPGEGTLSFFEGERDIPFAIRRVYYIYDTPAGVQRGGHAHRKLRQMLFCPYGSILIKLDDGKDKVQVLLDRPDKGLVLESCLWREMLWNKAGSVLCVAASEFYNEADYIRDYSQFLNYIAQNKGE